MNPMIRWMGVGVGCGLVMGAAGCASPRPAAMSVDHLTLQRRAMASLTASVGYKDNPVVRVEAVEALESSGRPEALPWIRTAVLDEHPAVRFAACVAVGRLRDAAAAGAVRQRLTDADAGVRVAALFAQHRLGNPTATGRIPTYLLHHEDVSVRRNAALLLGLLEEPDAVKVLARAMRDADAGVRHHALEAMARYGNPEARQELVFMTNAGVGSEEVFAIHALAGTDDPTYVDTFRYKLATATHQETRLAAARALGRLGFRDGFDVALRSLDAPPRIVDDPNDPPEGQVLRVRQMAAAALGAIGSVEALPALTKLMDDPADPRVQVSAAKAVLEVIAADHAPGPPFGRSDRVKGKAADAVR